MTNHNFTIVLLSNRIGMHSYTISLKELIRRMLLLCAFFAVVSMGIAYSSYDIRLKVEAIESLEKEKLEILNKLETLKPYSEYENYRTVLNRSTITAVDKKRRGIGGDEYSLELGAMEFESGPQAHSGRNVSLNSDRHLDIISGVFMKYAELHHKVTSMQNRLDHLPSIFPVSAPILSGFGNRLSPFTGRQSFHRGVDLACETGTPIASPASGTVINVSTEPLWGLSITVDHGYGIITRFGHLDKVFVKQGDRVNRWDIIARSGQSGRATGPHLHYQIWLEGEPIDPALFVMNNDRES